MAKKKLNYTGLTYQTILNQINAKIAADSRFDNFRESALATLITEIFAGVTDLTNYYIERRAEESYLETAKLKSSVIQLSKQLGYVVTRPIPAASTITMTIRGGAPLSNYVVAGSYIELGIYTPFTYDSNPFLLKNTYKYIFTATDAVNFQSSSYTKTITYGLENTEVIYNLYKDADLVDESDTVTMDIIQGELKYTDIPGSTNSQLDKNFQIYKIDDATFSNIYGLDDYDTAVTRVCVNAQATNPYENSITPTSGSTYTVDRRSLINQSTLLANFNVAEKICLIRTTPDEKVELLFGDGNYAELGARSGAENIYVQYLSTLGSNVNKVGVVGDAITCDNSIYLDNDSNKNISANISFHLGSNIQGGADLESMDSIKTLAPGIYYALDRVVTQDDYVAYLKSLTSPINIKNAIAWGEQEEGAGAPIKKLFNVVLFSVFGELYKQTTTPSIVWDVKESDTGEGGEMSDAVLDSVDLFTQYPDHSYFNLLVKESSPGVSRTLEAAHLADSGSNLNAVYTNLNTKSQLTIRNVYVSPIVHEFEVSGSVYVNNLADSTQLTTDIKNAVYSFLNNNADFNSKIYASNIIEIVEDFDDVNYANIDIVPSINTGTTFGTSAQTFGQAFQNDTDFATWASTTSASNAIQIIIASVAGTAYTNAVSALSESVSGWSDLRLNTNLESKTTITEEWFNKTLLDQLYTSIDAVTSGSNLLASTYYGNMIVKMHNTISYIIKYNIMRNSSGVKKDDILTYSLKNEIAKVTFTANVFFDSN